MVSAAITRATTPVGASRLTRAAYLNSIASLLDFGSVMAVGLIVTPVLLRSLDSSLFGVWKILQQLVNYMVLVDGRPTQALKWVIATQQASDDYVLKRRTVGTALVTWLIYLPLIMVVGGLLVWLAPSLTHVPPEYELLVRLTCGVLVLNFVLLGLAQIPASVLRGENQGYRRMGMAATINLLGAAFTISAVKLGLGLVGIAAAQVLVTLLTGYLFYVAVRRYLAWFGSARPDRGQVFQFARLSGWYLASMIVDRLVYGTDVVVLGFVASSAAVTPYVVTSFASTTAAALLGAVIGGGIPGLGGLLGRREYDRIAAIRGEMFAYSWLLVTVVGTATLLLNRSFVQLWVGAGRYTGWQANLLIVLITLQLVFIRNEAYLIDLSLKLRLKVMLGLIGGVLSVAIAATLIPAYGIVGLCLGLIAGRAVLTIGFPILVGSQLHVRFYLTRQFIGRALVTLMLFCAAAYFGDSILVRNWPVWIGLGCAITLCTIAICAVVGLSASERQVFIRRARVLMPA